MLTVTLNVRSQRVTALLGAMVLFVFACGGGGGGSNGRSSSDNVTITGTVTDGSGALPLSGAVCEFVDAASQQYDTDICDSSGAYELNVPPGLNGFIRCGPQSMPSLRLTSFSSTVGYAAGQNKGNENITPTTTVVADIIRHENPSDPEARKSELVLQAIHDPNLAMVTAMAGRLFRAMVARQVNTQFGDDRRDGDGRGGDGNGAGDGGVGGDAGDGADFSPLPGAECAFVLDDFTSDEPVSLAAISDFLDDGVLNRPDLAALSSIVMNGVTQSSEEIRLAFEAWFPEGSLKTLSSVTDSQGSYFLPVPPNLPGYVRCTPQNRRKLFLGAYVPGRQAGERLMDQDVTPATTLFSTLIAPQFTSGLLGIRDNFLDDIEGLEVRLTGTNLPGGQLDQIRLGTDTQPADTEVGLAAFSAVALFNALHKNNLDVDFPAVIIDLYENLAVVPAFLEGQGLTAVQAQEVSSLVNTSISTAESDLGTMLESAFGTARVRITVLGADGGTFAGAVVDIENDLTCAGCGDVSDSNGQVVLTLSGVPEAATEIGITVSAEPDYGTVRITTNVAAFSTVDVTAQLSSTAGDLGTISGAVVDALTDTPLGGVRVSVLNNGQQVATATTDSLGSFTVQCAIGAAYSVSFNIDGYLPTRYDNVTVTAASTTFLETVLQVSVTYSGNGGIAGTIRNALNNAVIAGVSLQLRDGVNNFSGGVIASTTTDTSGGYSFSDIPAGLYTLSATHSDYLDAAVTVISVGGETRNNQDGSMSPQLRTGSIRIVLTWGATPFDLDSHLFGPSSSGGTFHCYYGNKNPDPGHVNLDLDDTVSYGPETTTIERRLQGTYRFQVFDYSNLYSVTSNALSNSGAQVKVYDDTGEIATYNVPSGRGGTVWTVFELDGDTGSITPRNTMSYESRTTTSAAHLMAVEKQ